MTSSRSFASSVSIAFVACLLAGTGVYAAVTIHAGRAFAFVSGVAYDFLRVVTAKFEQPVLRLAARPIELAQSCACALQLAKRQRPHVRDTWRMCPST